MGLYFRGSAEDCTPFGVMISWFILNLRIASNQEVRENLNPLKFNTPTLCIPVFMAAVFTMKILIWTLKMH